MRPLLGIDGTRAEIAAARTKTLPGKHDLGTRVWLIRASERTIRIGSGLAPIRKAPKLRKFYATNPPADCACAQPEWVGRRLRDGSMFTAKVDCQEGSTIMMIPLIILGIQVVTPVQEG